MPAELTTADSSAADLHKMLDDGLASLDRGDREVVLLRYLQGREFTDLGASLGISEQAARKRLNRAVIRLRRYFAVSGAGVAPAVVISALETAGRQAPAHLLHSTMTAATASAVKTSGAFVAAKTIHVMTWVQMKIAAGIVVAAIAASAGTAIVIHRVLAASPAASQASPNPAMPTAETLPTVSAPFTAVFQDGMKVELLGMNVNPAGNNPWWQPDGTPLARAPYRSGYNNVSGDFGKPYEFGVRLTGAPPGTDVSLDTTLYIFRVMSSWNGPTPDVTAYATLFAPDEPATIRFRYATKSWRKALSVKAQAVFTTGATVDGVSFTPGHDPKDPAGITMVNSVAADLFKQDWRLVALDAKNIVHQPMDVQSNGNMLFQTTKFRFRSLKREDVMEYQITTRPYDRWVEFQNVSLTPGEVTDVKIQTSESPATK